ncbi:DNA recombination protein RmuC [Nocardioides aequoreus]|uniref:DNA recombination protein RmuC n=1 Tax=Nocardioides aequoreus TaxID=397278 RepID=UPI000690A04D|nr:DNA recombination protein RmuC [Nocardioides aequoreus]
MDVLLPLLTLVVGLLLGSLITLLRTRPAETGDDAVLRDGLERLHDRLLDVERQRASWQGQLHQQVEHVRDSADRLREETGALATALRRPHVRGRWGEMHLRRTVELAGMVEHCDFTEQATLDDPDGHDGAGRRLRPDLVVHLAGGRSLAVDAKVPLEAHLDALAASTPNEVAAHLRRHARQLRTHVDQLSSKAYWRALPGSPELVVLFLPAESFLAAALEADPDLIAHAAGRDVVLATPTSLIALLRTAAHGWAGEALAERTREIHELGRELHGRLAVMSGHLERLGRSLGGAVDAYNSTVGSWESRVLVTARTFEDTRVTRASLTPVTPVTATTRPLTAPEARRPETGEDPGESHRSTA